MTLWITLSLALAATALLLLWPFLRRPSATINTPRDIAMFKQQLTELESERQRGTVPDAEAAETRREIESRIVAAAKRQDTLQMTETPERSRMIAVALTMGWLVVGSVALYAAIGRSDLAEVPATTVHRPLSLAIGQPAPSQTAPAANDQPNDVNSMIAKLAARLDANPDDLAGWQMLAWSHLNTGNTGEAAKAYERAVALAPENAELASLWGEAVVRSAGGVVTEPAAEIFRRSLSLDPTNPRARFFEGLALDQKGQRAEALQLWQALLDDTPAGADWRDGLIGRIREAAAATGQSVGQIASGQDLLPPGPSAEDVAAAQQMSAEDRQDMIRGMVDGLAARLADAPDDPEGWARLIRSYGVLADAQAQQKALTNARTALADNPGGLALVNAAAQDAGLN